VRLSAAQGTLIGVLVALILASGPGQPFTQLRALTVRFTGAAAGHGPCAAGSSL